MAFRTCIGALAATVSTLALSPAHAEDAEAESRSDIVVNGQRNAPEPTEDTGDFTSRQSATATRMLLSPRETPQSISIVTRAQMDDFALRNANAVLAATTGVNVELVETDRTYFSARGFEISNFQIDGLGLPFASGDQMGDIDTAAYDRIEVLRGANGLLSSTGNPAATVNFIRKRPTSDFRTALSGTYGSWDNVRLDADISGPLNSSGTIRARGVAMGETRDSYLDRYSIDKTLFYGTVEADLSSRTTLAIGHLRQDNEPRGGMWGALPLYFTDGTPTNYDRSTSTAADWSYWNTRDRQSFAELSHDLSDDWSLRATVHRRVQKTGGDLFYVYGTPDPDTGLGLYSYPSRYDSTERQWIADIYATGNFTAFGREHDLVVGGTWSRSKSEMLSGYSADIGTPLPDLATWDGSYTRPSFDASYGSANFTDRRESAYAALRINVADPFKLIGGLNLTHVKSEGEQYDVVHQYGKTKLTPYIGAVYDLADNVSAYASYARIFKPQHETDIDSVVLAPIEGSNLELGIKGGWFEDRLNASLAIFRVKQDNTAEYAGYNFDIGQSYYSTVDATSEGVELDIAGRITPALQISGGVTLLRIEDEDGLAARTYVPRQTVKLAATWTPPILPGLTLGANLKWQGDIKRDQGVTADGDAIVTRQGDYALVGLMARYDINDHWSVSGNLNNLTNEKYITSLYWAQGYYGAPRNGSVTVSWRF